MEVRAQAVAQVDGLAHVDHAAGAVLHDVDAWFSWSGSEDALEFG